MITLVWMRDTIYAEAEFGGDGLCYVYARTFPEEHGEGVEGIPVTPALDPQAEAVLSRLAPKHLFKPLSQVA